MKKKVGLIVGTDAPDFNRVWNGRGFKVEGYIDEINRIAGWAHYKKDR